MTTDQPTTEPPSNSIPIAHIRAAVDSLGITDFDNIRAIHISPTRVMVVHLDALKQEQATSYRVDRSPLVECPQCHTPIGRPHTEYCTLAPDQVWDGVLPDDPWTRPLDGIEVRPARRLVCRRCNGYGLLGAVAGVNPVPCPDCAIPACAYPSADHGDGRGCQHDDCPKHGGR